MSRLDRLRRALSGEGGAGGRRTLVEWLAVGLLTSALVLWLSFGGPAQRLNGAVYDALMGLRGGTPDDRVLVVAIDNRSLEGIGRWPWSREVHAALVDRLSAQGVRAIGYDVLFIEPGPGDAALVEAVRRSGRVYLPMAVDPLAQGEDRRGVLTPLPALREAAAGLGHVNLTVDPDGVVRRLPVRLPAGDVEAPHLALRLAEAAGAAPTGPLPNPVLVGWRGPPGQFRTVSAVDVLNGETPPSVFRDRIVLVGMTADGQGDRYAGPVGRGLLFPGVEIQAALLDTLLEGAPLRAASPVWVAVLSLVLVWLLLAVFLMLDPRRSLLAALGAFVVVLAVCLTAFRLGLWIAPAAALAGVAAAYPLWSWRRLEAASAWFRTELAALARDDLLDAAPADGAASRPPDAAGWALDRLRNLRRFIADALRSLPDATVVVDGQRRVLMANDRAEALFGAGHLPGSGFDALIAGLGAERAPAAGDGEISIPGAVLHVEEAPLQEASAGAGARIIRLADVTALRTAQRQREEALQLLSHDMRAPQAAILSLLDGQGGSLDPELRRRLANNARLTLKLAEDYVQLARAESQDIAREPVDLVDVVTDAADILWSRAGERGVKVRTPEADGEVLVAGDRALLTRVFLNLIDNAVKFSPRDTEVECTVERDPEAPGLWLASVQDRGPGLPPDLGERLFTPFARGDGAGVGVGLGLAFVRTVAERHGGRVECRDRAGGGAVFSVRLPVLDA